ncbi:MAG: ABC transporter permease subunit [Methylobacteriaceae bacterium]|jgi:taurine transport system permease protein|nr:ABC transporter permease subunit [Methylobacteriaceae bacterium]
MTIWRRSAISILSVVSVLALWQLAGTLRWVDPLLLPAPSEVLQTAVFLAANGYQQVPLWQHIFVSVARALAAFFVAVLVGIPLGLLMGLNASLDAALDPFIQFLRPLPKIALIPLTVVWFGIGETSKFFLIFIACFLSVVVGASAAVLNVQRDRIRAAKLLGADRWQIFRFVIIPHTLPELFTSVRLSIGIGWTALIAAELVAATAGLGWMVLNAGNYLRTDIVILGILLLGIIGYALDLMLVLAQKHFVPWAGKDA